MEDRQRQRRRVRGQSNAFDYLFTGVVPWLLIVGAAVVTELLATERMNPGNVPWQLVILAATVIGFVLILIRLIIGHDADPSGGVELEISRGVGIWVSALGGLIAAVAALIGFRQLGLVNGDEPAADEPPRGEIPPTTT